MAWNQTHPMCILLEIVGLWTLFDQDAIGLNCQRKESKRINDKEKSKIFHATFWWNLFGQLNLGKPCIGL